MSSDHNERQASTSTPEATPAATTEMKSTPSGIEAKLENNFENKLDSKPEIKPDNKLETNSHKAAWERDTLERLAFATLAEQRANRRWRIFFRLPVIPFTYLIPKKAHNENFLLIGFPFHSSTRSLTASVNFEFGLISTTGIPLSKDC
mgnify:CR=1 FL=1